MSSKTQLRPCMYAAYYSQMFMYATVTLEGQFVKFESARNTSDLGGTVLPGGEEVTFTDMKGYNGTLASWSEAVKMHACI